MPSFPSIFTYTNKHTKSANMSATRRSPSNLSFTRYPHSHISHRRTIHNHNTSNNKILIREEVHTFLHITSSHHQQLSITVAESCGKQSSAAGFSTSTRNERTAMARTPPMRAQRPGRRDGCLPGMLRRSDRWRSSWGRPELPRSPSVVKRRNSLWHALLRSAGLDCHQYENCGQIYTCISSTTLHDTARVWKNNEVINFSVDTTQRRRYIKYYFFIKYPKMNLLIHRHRQT